MKVIETVKIRKYYRFFLLFCMAMPGACNLYAQIIIDHTCTDINKIPVSAIESAKDSLHIAYDHTSHGSQLITGMNPLDTFMGGHGIYVWSEGGGSGLLDIDDYFSPVKDLGYETSWPPATRTYLENPTNADVNVIMWSWCNIYGHNIQGYLDSMEVLISDYGPGGTKILDGTRTVPVTFVFMTGHTNMEISQNEWTFNANKQIRQHCIANNRVLYDFFDIENYNPDGTYFGDGDPNTADYGTYNGNNHLDDDCSYDSTETSRGNWAIAWQSTHSQGVDWYSCSAVHSQPLNGNLKAYACWWMFARLAGWIGPDTVSVKIKVFLEGPYNNGTMNTDLQTAGYLPLESPYDTTTVSTIPADVVDWVQVELRSEADGSGDNYTKSAFLRNDGMILDGDGSETIAFNAPENDYFIAVKHRNHLSIMSDSAVLLEKQ
ncbi:hypothetical protein JW835_00590 [bacterium]|nr:hypothetical protein [bacterium]